MDLQDASPNRRHTRRTARAKVNLALAVDKPNAEAMHPICSWMARINLADDLHITRLEDDRLSRYAIRWHDEAPIKTNIDWSITADLAVRAHLLLEDETARRLPVQLRLDKRIPVGGGLGGGSADAAATLSAVNELFDLNIPHDRLAQLALTLGSDVPFFLSDHPTGIVSGLGESFEPTAPVSAALVLIFPAFGCPTGPVYRAFDNLPAASFRADTIRALARADSIDSSQLFNDLAPAAEAVAPRHPVPRPPPRLDLVPQFRIHPGKLPEQPRAPDHPRRRLAITIAQRRQHRAVAVRADKHIPRRPHPVPLQARHLLQRQLEHRL
ncbi:MAG: hypothetical protein KDA30_10360 [Phycisphaerales bacterium]|nr:hypothetical protein [Phycisphaerales bacterium]